MMKIQLRPRTPFTTKAAIGHTIDDRAEQRPGRLLFLVLRPNAAAVPVAGHRRDDRCHHRVGQAVADRRSDRVEATLCVEAILYTWVSGPRPYPDAKAVALLIRRWDHYGAAAPRRARSYVGNV